MLVMQHWLNKLLIISFLKLISLLKNLISSMRKEYKQFSLLWYFSHAPLLSALFEPKLLLVDDSVLIGDLRQPVLTLVLVKVPSTVTHSVAEDVSLDSKLLLLLHTTYSSYSSSIKASNTLRFGVTEMLIRGTPSLAVRCTSQDRKNGFQSGGAMEHWQVLPATMVGRPEIFWILDALEWLKQ